MDENSMVIDPDNKDKFITMEEARKKLNNNKMLGLKGGIRVRGLKLDNYEDNIKQFYITQPFFYDKNNIFWFWNISKDRWEILDEIDLMNLLDYNLEFYGQTIGQGIKSNYIEAFKRIGRQKQPKEAPKKWIQFKDKAYSLTSGEIHTVTPDYFFTNPIQWELGNSTETPIMDKFIVEWVGDEYKLLMYQIIAYCLYRYLPIHRVFFFIGEGCNGKTTFLQLLLKFIGIENTCSTELDNIVGQNAGRFESIKMYKKLACFMGETNFTSMGKTSMLKKLCDNSLIGYEMKGKQPFDDYNYAKMIIASNGLPITSDKTDGFWRRCLTIEFPNKFKEGRDIIQEIPDIEYNNLALKCCKILPELLKAGCFDKEDSIADREKKYTMASNPLPIFIQKCCKVSPELYHRYGEFYNEYLQWLKKHKKRPVGKKEFSKLMNEENFEIRRTSKDGEIDYYIEGIQFCTDCTDFKQLPIPSLGEEKEGKISEIETIKAKTDVEIPEKHENILEWDEMCIKYHWCNIKDCPEIITNITLSGKYYCKTHWKEAE